MRKTYLKENEVKHLEAMTEAEVGALIFRDGLQRGAELMHALMRNYRIASTVANAAWKVVQEADAGEISAASFKELRQALHLYAPKNFRPYKGDLEYGCRLLEELYDYLAQWGGKTPANSGVMLEKLFERITFMRSQLPNVLS